MAKDPAFLFYPGDWQGGTMYFDHQTKGAYMDLMVLQFNVGKFTEAQAKQVLSICFAYAWPMLQLKFKTDGTYYWNERLQFEIEKRQNFTKTRRENALGVKKPKAYANASAEHMHKHMENENENENIDKVKTKKESKKEFAPDVKLTIQEDEKLKEEFGVVIIQAAYLFLSSYKAEKGYKTKSDNLTIRRWVIDAVKKQSNGSGSNQQSNIFTGNKLGTSEARVAALKEWGHNRGGAPHREGDQHVNQ